MAAGWPWLWSQSEDVCGFRAACVSTRLQKACSINCKMPACLQGPGGAKTLACTSPGGQLWHGTTNTGFQCNPGKPGKTVVRASSNRLPAQ
jgi:hypothetical protein